MKSHYTPCSSALFVKENSFTHCDVMEHITCYNVIATTYSWCVFTCFQTSQPLSILNADKALGLVLRIRRWKSQTKISAFKELIAYGSIRVPTILSISAPYQEKKFFFLLDLVVKTPWSPNWSELWVKSIWPRSSINMHIYLFRTCM